MKSMEGKIMKINTKAISWTLVLKFVVMLMNVLGKTEEQAISMASMKYGMDGASIKRKMFKTLK